MTNSKNIPSEKLWLAVEQSANSIFITNPSGDIEYANSAFCILSGYSAEEIKGKNARILKSGQMEESIYEEMWQSISAGKRWQGELLNKRKNGSVYWCQLTISPIHDSNFKVIAYLGVEEDISERKSLEERLKNSNSDLIDAITEIKQFNSMLSHDLKAPLATIKMSLTLVEEMIANHPNPKAHQLLQSALTCSDQMLTIITEMSQFARIGASKDKFEDVDLNHVLALALSNLEGRITRNKAQIYSEKLPHVNGIKGLLVMLFQNIIENGLKYNESEKPIINISQVAGQESIKLLFEDNGIGIAPEKIKLLFLPFSRLHSKSKYDGSGLGLAGCKKICELHSWDIYIDPDFQNGARFCVEIKAVK